MVKLSNPKKNKDQNELIQKIVSFRGARIPHYEVEVLLEMENLFKRKFIIANKIESSDSMSFIAENQKVTGINLSNCEITVLPNSIGMFTALKNLDLQINKLKILPESLKKLKLLEKLWLRGNNLEFISETINNLRFLKELDLKHNRIKNLPETIGDLKFLEYLDLGDNNLTALPKSMGNLKLLRILILDNNDLESLPKSFEGLISLELLSLYGNKLTYLPASFVNFILTNKERRIGIEPLLARNCKIEGTTDEIKSLINLNVLLPWKNGQENDIKKNLILATTLCANIIGIKTLGQTLKDGSLSNEIKRFIEENLVKVIEQLKPEDIKRKQSERVVYKLIQDLSYVKSICYNLCLKSIGDVRKNYFKLEDLLGNLIKNLKSQLSLSERIKNFFRKIPELIKKAKLSTWIYLFILSSTILLGILVIAPFLNVLDHFWLSIFLIIGTSFSFIAGLGVFPTISSYIKRAYTVVELFGGVYYRLEKFQSKMKNFLIFLLDVGIIVYLINSIRKIVKILIEIELIPFTILIELLDFVLMGLLFSIFSSLLIIHSLYIRGIRHLWTASSEPLKVKGKSHYLVLFLGIIGAFMFMIVKISTYELIALLTQNIGVSIGALIYLELRFKKRWRLRIILYLTIFVGIFGSYIAWFFLNLLSYLIIAIISTIFFLLILIESSKRSYWLSDCFEPYWRVKHDVKYARHQGILVEREQESVLRLLEDLSKTVLREYKFIPEEEYSDTSVYYQSKKGNVVSIGLMGRNLKSVPESISNLTSLRVLELSGNQLTDLPNSIGNLNIETLILSSNQFTTFPKIIKYLVSLKLLDLNYNKIFNLPDSISNLKFLKFLYLSGNSLMSLPKLIGKLVSLIDLDLSLNKIRILPESICNLTSLQKLNLEFNKLNTLPKNIDNLKSLIILNLINNNFNSLPESIGNLRSLKELKLSFNQLVDIPESIENLKSLEYLSLSGNRLNTLSESLSKIPSLQILDLKKNPLINNSDKKTISILKKIEENGVKILL